MQMEEGKEKTTQKQGLLKTLTFLCVLDGFMYMLDIEMEQMERKIYEKIGYLNVG